MMGPTYYQIELSARMLTVLLVVLALLLVLAFAFGYGAAWSVLSQQPQVAAAPTATSTPLAPESVATALVATAPTPLPRRPTSLPEVEPSRSVPPATATPRPRPTATARPAPTRVPTPVPTAAVTTGGSYWVQVLAVGRRDAVEEAQAAIEGMKDGGFPRSMQQVIRTPVAGGGVLYKLRLGPFPQESAYRVMRRMRDSGFPDAWVLQE